MAWLLLSLLAAFLDAVYYLIVKRQAKKFHYAVLASATFFVCFAVLAIVTITHGIPSLGPLFWPVMFAAALTNFLAASLYFRMIPMTDLSLAVPMLSFTPAFLLIPSFFLLGELPTLAGIGGILLIVAGSYILNIHHLDRHILAPFHELVRNRGTRGMLIAAILFSFTIVLEKMVINQSDSFFGAMLITLIISLSFLAMAASDRTASLKAYQKSLPTFVALGFLLATTVVLFNVSIREQLSSYVISIKRLSILFSVILGCLVLKERHLFPRMIGALLMVAGAVVIVLS
ncbi:EamA family transporter [Candidatus Woesearchaeota archaeon]|nr:EamA family transporter [Candidatus Woesearchaeota archaeon]